MKTATRSTVRSRTLRGARPEESGSAYLIVLLVLVVLTILGLSLVSITQTEMQIGSSERVDNRTFYSADAGIGIATARVLVDHDHSAISARLPDSYSDSDPVPGVKLGETAGDLGLPPDSGRSMQPLLDQPGRPVLRHQPCRDRAGDPHGWSGPTTSPTPTRRSSRGRSSA